MTVKELRDLLAEYPGEAQVFVLRERKPLGTGGIMKPIEVTLVIDQDTAKGSVCLSPKLEASDFGDGRNFC